MRRWRKLSGRRRYSAVARFEDYDSVLAAVEAGLGVALLRLPLAERWTREGRLFRVSPHAIANPARHYVCTRANESRSSVLTLCERLDRIVFDPLGPQPPGGPP